MPVEVGDIVRIKEASSFPRGWVGAIGVVDYVYKSWPDINVRLHLEHNDYTHITLCIPLKSVDKL